MRKKGMRLSTKMLIGMVLGLIAGLIFGPSIAVIKPVGTIFVNLLKMCMVPVIFVSITLSVASVADLKTFGRIGGKIFGFYCMTSAIASIVGVAWASIVKPGLNFTGDLSAGAVNRKVPSLVDSLVGIVPTNIFSSLASATLMSVIFFAILFGVSISLIGEKKRPVIDLLESLNDAILKMINICLTVAPFGVFALMAVMTGKYGIDVIRPLAKFLTTEYLAILTQMFVVYGILLKIFGKLNIFKFVGRTKDALITAFSTTSSAATVPVELEIAQSHMGIPKHVAGFGFPLGATVNQDGAALNIPICLLFSAQIVGVSFTPVELVTIIVLSLFMSIGAAGIPAGASMFILMILSQFGVPNDAFGLILATYVLIDVGLTTINICGDMVCVTSVTRSEGLLDTSVWEPGYVPAVGKKEMERASA